MERPSHIAFASSPSHRLPLLATAAAIQAAIVWLFVHGLATGSLPHLLPPPIDVRFEPAKTEALEPPKPELQPVLPPRVEKPIFDVAPTADSGAITATTVTPPRTTSGEVTPPVPDSGPVAIAATHTLPPYPVIARRVGAEGKVTLRLTVETSGRVSAAQVVASSGRDDLDQAAQSWMVGHWTYKPALSGGQPVVGHVLATMVFNLRVMP